MQLTPGKMVTILTGDHKGHRARVLNIQTRTVDDKEIQQAYVKIMNLAASANASQWFNLEELELSKK